MQLWTTPVGLVFTLIFLVIAGSSSTPCGGASTDHDIIRHRAHGCFGDPEHIPRGLPAEALCRGYCNQQVRLMPRRATGTRSPLTSAAFAISSQQPRRRACSRSSKLLASLPQTSSLHSSRGSVSCLSWRQSAGDGAGASASTDQARHRHRRLLFSRLSTLRWIPRTGSRC
jgi:hypothetical protein